MFNSSSVSVLKAFVLEKNPRYLPVNLCKIVSCGWCVVCIIKTNLLCVCSPGPRRNLRNDLLIAADSITNTMSSLVKELNSGVHLCKKNMSTGQKLAKGPFVFPVPYVLMKMFPQSSSLSFSLHCYLSSMAFSIDLG